MIDAAKISKALFDIYRASPDLRNEFGNRMERGEYVNEKPGNTPWLGVYRTSVTYEPYQLGRHNRTYKAEVKLTVLIQATAMRSGEGCEDKIEALIKKVLDVTLVDPTIGGQVAMLRDIAVAYEYRAVDTSTMLYQQASITFTADVRTG